MYDWVRFTRTGLEDFFRRVGSVLLGEASREDEQKRSSQFLDEDHMKVIVAHNFQLRIIDK